MAMRRQRGRLWLLWRVRFQVVALVGSKVCAERLLKPLEHGIEPHALLSCEVSSPWAAFRRAVVEATAEGRPPCSLAGAVRAAGNLEELSVAASATSRAFARAVELYDVFADQQRVSLANVHIFFLLCTVMEEVPFANWGEWARESTIPNAEATLDEMLAVPGGGSLPPCLFGWLTAAVCLLQVQRDRDAGLWPDLDEYVNIQRSRGWDQNIAQEVLTAIDEDRSFKFDQLRWSLRNILYSPHKALVLLESSGWPVTLGHVLGFLPDKAFGKAIREEDMPTAHSYVAHTVQMEVLQRAWGRQDAPIPSRVRIWALSLHASLVTEPASIWAELGEIWGLQVEVTAMLIGGYCGFEGLGSFVGGCAPKGPLTDFILDNLDEKAPTSDGINRFPIFRDVPRLREGFLRIAPAVPELAQADVLFCGEPAYLCGLLLLLRRQPVAGFLGNMLGAYLPGDEQSDFYGLVAAAMANSPAAPDQPALRLVFTSSALAAQAHWQTGAHFPAVRPLGRYTGVTHWRETQDVLVTKQIHIFWDFMCLLNSAASGLDWKFVHMQEMEDRSWAAWARHRAAVLLPYEPQQMIFYEIYSMAVPLLVPSDRLLPIFFMNSYHNVKEVAHRHESEDASLPAFPKATGAAWGLWHSEAPYTEIVWWSALSDVARMPHTLPWSSVAELITYLLPSGELGLRRASHAMRRHTETSFLRAANFWHAALLDLAAQAPSGGQK